MRHCRLFPLLTATLLAQSACNDADDGDPDCTGRASVLAGSLELVGADALEQAADQLACTQVITGTLTIEAVASLAPLRRLVHVQGDLRLEKVQSLEGLEALREVDGLLRIAESPELTTLAPLSSLERVGGSLWLRQLSSVSDLRGLEKLSDVGGLELTDNPSLVDLAALKSLGRVDGPLVLSSNPALVGAAIGWVPDRLSASGPIEISRCDALQELPVLSVYTFRKAARSTFGSATMHSCSASFSSTCRAALASLSPATRRCRSSTASMA